MNKNDISRLKRQDLLEMLLELSKENERLRRENEELEEQLQDRELKIGKMGSVAEAALQLNGVFKAAQEACEQYVYNTQLRCKKIEEDAKNKYARMLEEAKQKINPNEEEI